MIVRLRGELLEKNDTGAVVEAGGVGYEVFLAPGALQRLPSLGQEVRLYVVESTAMYNGGTTLYGFLADDERRVFNVLRDNVPNTGAKKALELLDKILKAPGEFHRAVADKDARSLVTLLGFTPKTAEKLVAALHGKLDGLTTDGPSLAGGGELEEAVAGLVALGYREPAARAAAQAARDVLGTSGSAQTLIRESLRHLSGRN